MFRPLRRERVLAQRVLLNLRDAGLGGRWGRRWLNQGTSTMTHAHPVEETSGNQGNQGQTTFPAGLTFQPIASTMYSLYTRSLHERTCDAAAGA
jgi:hypothetical protein